MKDTKDTLERLVRLIKRQQETKGDRCHLLLAQQAHSHDIFDGYKSLAALLKAGYFSTIVTTNPDDLLEKALEELNVFPPAYQVVIFGRDPDEKVAIALDGQESGICIIKLPAHEHVLFAADIQDSLRSYLRENIVIVGYVNGSSRSVTQTLDVERAKGSIYYIVPGDPGTDILLSQLQRRYKQYENFLMCGPDGKFVPFFDKLARLLSCDGLISSAHGIILNGDQHPRTEGEAADTSNGGNHSVLADSLALKGLINETEPSPVPLGSYKEETIEATSTKDWSKREERPGANVGLLEDKIRNTGPLEDQVIKSGPLTFDPSLDERKNAIRQLPWPADVDVLIAVVTGVELKAVLAHHPAYIRRTIREKTYYDLGYIGQARTAVVQANDMGPLAAQATVDEGIRVFSPHAVIMTGIAFGVRTKEQQIGDVLVSRLIHDYDSERVGTDKNDQLLIHQRGTRVKASGWLIDRFSAGNQDWLRPPEIHFGAILSGSRLVDNREYQNALLRSAQDAIGGEMEGAGLSEAANRYRIGWLLVKGISDWGDGTKGENKGDNQQRAAENAARFVLFVIGQEDFMHKP